jgi:oligosaccharide repeat unit polymerase
MIAFFLFILTLLSINFGGLKSPDFLLVGSWTLGYFVSLIFGQSELIPNKWDYLFIALFLVDYATMFLVSKLATGVRSVDKSTVALKPAIAISFLAIAIATYYVFSTIGKDHLGLLLSEFLAERRSDALNSEGDLYDNPVIYYAVRISLPAAMTVFYLFLSSKYNFHTALYVGLIFLGMVAANLIDGARSNVVVSVIVCFIMIYYKRKTELKVLILPGLVFAFLFVFSSIIFRQHEDINVDSIVEGFSFGAVESMKYAFDGTISTYWGDYDMLVRKIFNLDLAMSMGAKTSFIPEYSPTLWKDKYTNVYSAYAVYFDYFGFMAVVFIFLKAVVISVFYKLRELNQYFEMSYFFLAACLPLSLFHDYFLTLGVLALYAVGLLFLSNRLLNLKI